MKRKIRYLPVKDKEEGVKFMWLGRWCSECKRFYCGLQFMPIAYNCIGEWGFRCPENHGYLTFLPKDKETSL